MAECIQNAGHALWLDEWRIQVGHSITAEIERGLGDATFVILMLSESAVTSRWVEREWRAAYHREVSSDRVVILPALVEPCAIPSLLVDKRYASLFPDVEQGIGSILQTISHHDRDCAHKDFFAPIASLLRAERAVEEPLRTERNAHWDYHQDLVNALPQEQRRVVQELNTLSYLSQYNLTISQLKTALYDLGFECGEIDNVYEDAIALALEKFQRTYNLRHVDGIFGPVTYLAMAQLAGRT